MLLKDEIIEVLKAAEDPELHIDLWTLGLVYGIDFDEATQKGTITMTYTTPLCPYGPQMTEDIKKRIAALDANAEVEVKVVFDPPWKPSDEVRAMLGV
jgi:metal-sulfur cluster biosynthetic enzyme